MKGIILYQSKYGATRKYAAWLAEATGFACVETRKAKIEQVRSCDVIILGGGIYASGIAGLSFLKKNIAQLRDKKIIVFCAGASPFDEQAFQQLKALNMKNELAQIPLVYCRGAWNIDKMGVVDKSLCRMLQKATAKKEMFECAVWERALLEAGEKPCDWTDRKYIQPVLDMLK